MQRQRSCDIGCVGGSTGVNFCLSAFSAHLLNGVDQVVNSDYQTSNGGDLFSV